MTDLQTEDGLMPIPVIEAAAAAVLPDRPRIEWLPLGSLCVNSAYQRQILRRGKKIIEKIAGDFHWARFGIVTVMDLGDGRYCVLDGQHRCAALLAMGAAEVLCLIAPKGNLQEQAAHFIGINGARTALTPLAQFKARIMAGDTSAIEVREFVQSAGINAILYQPNPKNMTTASFNAYNGIEGIWKDKLKRPDLFKAMQIAAISGQVFISGRLVKMIYAFVSDGRLSSGHDIETVGAAIHHKGAAVALALASEHRAETGDMLSDSGALVVWRVVMDYVEAHPAPKTVEAAE